MIDLIHAYQRIAISQQQLEELRDKADKVLSDRLQNGYLCFILKNMKVIAKSDTISFTGSVSKSFLGNNVNRLYFEDFNDWVNKFSNALGMDISNFIIGKLDLNFDIPTIYPPYIYQKSIIKLNHSGRFYPDRNTLYCKAHDYTVRIYDKKKEAIIYDPILGHTLRIEFAFKRRLGYYLFGGGYVMIRDIQNESGYKKLYGLADKFFKRIIMENRDDTLDFSNCRTPRQVKDAIVKNFALELGGQTGVEDWVERLRSYDKFMNIRGYSRLKEMLKKDLSPKESKHDFVREIRNKYYSLVRYQL